MAEELNFDQLDHFKLKLTRKEMSTKHFKLWTKP